MRAVLAVVMIVALHTRDAGAHEDENPEAHRSMPNQVFASASVSAAHHSGDFQQGYDFTADGVGLGLTIGFAREFGRHFDLRLRLSYQKPLPDDDVLLEGLHELHVTLAPELLGYGFGDALTFTLGPEVGLSAARLTFDPPMHRTEASASASGAGISVAMTAGVRTWVTYHAGLFAEVSAGTAQLWGTLDMRSGWLGRVSIGWADRF